MKSPIGILFYDKEGRLITANQSAKDIAGIPESEDVSINLFNNQDIASRKEKLIDDGIIKFQSQMNFENIRKAGYYSPTRSDTAYLDFVISIVDSGYLVQIQDITKRKKAEELLKESESYYRTIFENTGTAFMIFEEDTIISLINSEAEEILGYSKGEVEGKKKWTEFIAQKEDLNRMREYHRLRRENTSIAPKKYEFQAVDKRGNVKNIIITISMIPGTKKSIASFLDITKLKRAEEELQKSEAEYRELVENANSIILKMDKNGHITFFNEFAENFFGFKKEEVIGKNVIGTIVPEIESFGRDLQEIINMIIKDPEAHINLENENITCNGRRIWVAWTNRGIYNDKGEVIGVLSIGTDISKRKHAEEALQKAHNNLELKVQKRTRELRDSNNALRNEIEERKQVEYKLKEQLNFLQHLMDAIPAPIFYKDTNYVYLSCNLAFEEVMGLPREKIIGKTQYDIASKELADRYYEMDRKLFETPGTQVYETLVQYSDGTMHNVIFNKATYTDIGGNVIGIIGIILDITESKQAEEALIESRNFLDKIINSIADPVFVKDMQHRWVLLNDAYCNFMGYSREELLEKSDYDFFPSHEADVFWEKDEEVFETGVENVNEEEFTDSEGNVHIIITKKTLYTDISGEKYIVAAIRDVTGRKKAEKELFESEQKYRTLFNSSPDYTILVGVDGNLMDVNDAAQEIVGLSREDLTGKNYTELKLLLDEEMPLHIKKFSQILKGNIVKSYESRFIDKNGEIHYVETFLKPLREDGKIIALNVIAHDISERKKAEKKLKEIIEELERSNYELQQFAYITSHDLQEPLRTIASFTQLLERRYKGRFDHDADEFMDFIVDAAVRMKGMIQGLLEYSRIGTNEIEYEEVNMNVKLKKALSNLKASIDKNKAEINHDHLPTVFADPDQMVRVFQNLIGNAIKFRKEGEPPKIHIACQRDKENNKYIFEVKDNGIGMEKEYTDKIFEVFKRLHTVDRYRGTGIGLSVVKRIIEQHGGRIWVESEFGEGSVFYFTLPVNPIEKEAEEIITPSNS